MTLRDLLQRLRRVSPEGPVLFSDKEHAVLAGLTDQDLEQVGRLAAIVRDRDQLAAELSEIHTILGAGKDEHPVKAARRMCAMLRAAETSWVSIVPKPPTPLVTAELLAGCACETWVPSFTFDGLGSFRDRALVLAGVGARTAWALGAQSDSPPLLIPFCFDRFTGDLLQKGNVHGEDIVWQGHRYRIAATWRRASRVAVAHAALVEPAQEVPRG